jgi:glycerol-3-phosphate dehydrogenase
MPAPLPIDCVVFGGGAAGLWVLDAALRSGRSALLLEAGELGSGQTVCAQGIIHGGFKYSLRGLLTASAEAIAEMPELWRLCEAGEREPTLRGMRIRAHHCHLWRTQSMGSTLAMMGAGLALRVRPSQVDALERPEVLRACPGSVARLDEQVIDPVSMLHLLSTRHRGRILKVDMRSGVEVRLPHRGASEPGPIISLIDPGSGDLLDLAPQRIVLAAGVGNESLRAQLGLDPRTAQRRPLHMVLLRSTAARQLTRLNGHCVDGARTRVTITSAEDSGGRVIWQLGGHLAEAGVDLEEAELLARASEELSAVLPRFDPTGLDWCSLRVDRAERRTSGGLRPDDAQVLAEGQVITLWPTKLALAPRGAALVLANLPPRAATFDAERVGGWTRPLVALPPWETAVRWRSS